MGFECLLMAGEVIYDSYGLGHCEDWACDYIFKHVCSL